MNNPEIAKHIEALKDKDWMARIRAAEALGKVGDVSAVPALIEVLKDKKEYVRGDAVYAFQRMGDATILPRKILAASRLSAPERVNLLKMLRGVDSEVRELGYNDPTTLVFHKTVLSYQFPDTHRLCEMVLHEEDIATHEGARTVLNWLNGDQDLLRASQRDTASEGQELLRAAQATETDAHPNTLLRGAEMPKTDTAEPKPSLWQRLRGKRS